MAWLPLHNEPERALAEEWLSWLDEGELLREDHFLATLTSGQEGPDPGSPDPVHVARLVRGALRAHAFSEAPAWLERGTRLATTLRATLPADLSAMPLADLADIQQAFSLAWTRSRESAWHEPARGLTEILKTRLESTSEPGTPIPRAERIVAAARLAQTAASQGDDELLAWAGEQVARELAAMGSEDIRPIATGGTAGSPDLPGIVASARLLRALLEADTCLAGFDIAESLPMLYRRFRDDTAPLNDPIRLKQACRDARTAFPWCVAELETTISHAVLIERFPAAARLAWLGLRDLWWTWRDPETWWLIPRPLRRGRKITADTLSLTLSLYAGLSDYLLGMRHCSQPLFE